MVLDLCGGCAVHCFLSLTLGWVCFWPVVSTAPVRCQFVVSPPSHVSVCPSAALAVGWFGHRSVAPPAAPMCWALVGSLFRRSVALGSWAPSPAGSLLVGSSGLVVLAPGVFLVSLLGVFPLASSGYWLLGVVLGLSLVIHPPLLDGGRCYPGVLSGACRLTLLGLRCLWVPRSCGVNDLRDGYPCLRSGLSTIVTKPFPPSGGFGSWPSCRVPCLRLPLCSSACVSPGGCPSFSQVGPAPSQWVPLLWTWLVWEASTASFSNVFLLDVVALWVNSVFLSLLIANEGLHWWLFLFRYSHPFWGRVVIFIRPP